MRKCRCCRQWWVAEAFAVYRRVDDVDRRRRTCNACRAGCKRSRERHYARNRDAMIARSRLWRLRLRDEVLAVRESRR